VAEGHGADKLQDPLLWDKNQPCKLSAEWNACLMVPFVHRQDWTAAIAHAFLKVFKDEFSLEFCPLWVGMVRSGKKAGATLKSPFYDRAAWNLAFVVHKNDVDKICNGHRLDVDVRWFFDVVAPDNGMSRRFPVLFKQQYNKNV
jgi:hypothetical protein